MITNNKKGRHNAGLPEKKQAVNIVQAIASFSFSKLLFFATGVLRLRQNKGNKGNLVY